MIEQMKKELKNIYDIAKHPENQARYHQLINHTSEVENGAAFWRDYDRAKAILDEYTDSNRKPCLEAEYSKLIKEMRNWLLSQGWIS